VTPAAWPQRGDVQLLTNIYNRGLVTNPSKDQEVPTFERPEQEGPILRLPGGSKHHWE
jgi:hypothetical protein